MTLINPSLSKLLEGLTMSKTFRLLFIDVSILFKK